MKFVNLGKIKLSQIFSSTASTVNLNNQTRPKFIKFLPSLPKFHFAKFSPKSIALTLVFVAVIAAAVLIILSQFGKKTTFTQNIRAETPINKLFVFPVISENGKLTESQLSMNLLTAQKMKTILIQGKPATAREGKIFLIINLEIANDHQQRLQILPVNLIRLVDSSDKKFAPDVHNENVIIEPISVKKTRVGFVVDEQASGLSLQVGEIDGAKETINLAI